MVKNPPANAGDTHKRRRFNPWVGKIPWRRKWQPIPLFLPGKFHGPRKLQSTGSQRVRQKWACTCTPACARVHTHTPENRTSFFKKFVFIIHLDVHTYLFYLRQAGSLIFVAACGIFSCSIQTLSCGMWELVLWPMVKPGVLATGPLGKSLNIIVFIKWSSQGV